MKEAREPLQNVLEPLTVALTVILKHQHHCHLPRLCEPSWIEQKGQGQERLVGHLAYANCSFLHGRSEQQDHVRPLSFAAKWQRAGKKYSMSNDGACICIRKYLFVGHLLICVTV